MTRRYERRGDPVAHAWTGDFEPLAKHIEAGGELNEEMRGVLVAILRGSLRFAKGHRRTFAQIQLDRDAALDISSYMLAGLSRPQAVRTWLDANPNLNAAILKEMLRRAVRDRASRLKQGSWVKMVKSAFAPPD